MIRRIDQIPAPRRHRVRASRDTCPTTRKVRYRDDREADDALHSLMNQARLVDEYGGRHTIRVRRKYRCHSCHGWHLTSWASWGTDPDAYLASDETREPTLAA